MRLLLKSLLALSILATGCASAPNPPMAASGKAPVTAAPATTIDPDGDWSVLRVGGDMNAVATFDAEDGMWRAGSSYIDTALPEGYPPPTPPGAIELKKYPNARRAEVRGRGRTGDSGFWPLFNHIKRQNIAMTAPVEFDYPTASAANPKISGWTMAFLYRTPDMNRTGVDSADERVSVRDAEPLTVVALGGRGSYDTTRVERDLKTLHRWLLENPQWVEAGAPRALMYNGPTLFGGRKWLEVQIPIKPAAGRQTAGM